MSKYIEPPKKPETSAMDKLTKAAKDAGSSLLQAVEDACTEAYNSVVVGIKEMVNAAVTGATSTYAALKKQGEDLLNQAEGILTEAGKKANEFKASVEEAYDDLMTDSDSYTSGEYQGTMFKQANDTVNNLSPKQLKELSETPYAVDSLSEKLTSAGQTDLKNNILK